MPSSTTSTTGIKFDSEGFDLDAAVSNLDLSTKTNRTTPAASTDVTSNNKEEVVYEIGGGTTIARTTTTTTATAGTTANDTTVGDGTNTTSTTTSDGTTACNGDSSSSSRSSAITKILQTAELLKEEGNDAYKHQQYQVAYEKYTAAIGSIENEAVAAENNAPATVDRHRNDTTSTTTTSKLWTGREILQKKDVWEQEQQLRLRNELRQRDSADNSNNNDTSKAPLSSSSSSSVPPPPSSSSSSEPTPPPPPQFVLDPPPMYGTVLATYYCNRAAASMQMVAAESSNTTTTTQKPPSTTTSTSSSWYDNDDDHDAPTKDQLDPKDQEALQDCTIAILLNPNYTKAYIRRATIYEHRFRPPHHSKTELALSDLLMAQSIEPHNRTVATHVRRLQQLEQERMERLKVETMSKLKDLGNSILSNFGLSLDNFQTQQDPKTGSYNISFSQN